MLLLHDVLVYSIIISYKVKQTISEFVLYSSRLRLVKHIFNLHQIYKIIFAKVWLILDNIITFYKPQSRRVQHEFRPISLIKWCLSHNQKWTYFWPWTLPRGRVNCQWPQTPWGRREWWSWSRRSTPTRIGSGRTCIRVEQLVSFSTRWEELL